MRNWLNEDRLQRHNTSAEEVEDLLKVVDRDLADAAIKEISADRRFATAYNAALQLATIVLYASGYRAGKSGHHWVTFKILPEVMGSESQERADYFNSCRSTRHVTDYDRAGVVSNATANEILQEAKAFKEEAIIWLKANHPDLLKRP
ncbi:MAG: SAV_6107 family HEPN domain-containing protein [Desulfobaccales bacterium]